MTETLTEFLLARIAEDEERARAQVDQAPRYFTGVDGAWLPEDVQATGVLIVHPVRVLAECEGKRGAIEAAWRYHLKLEDEWGHGHGRATLEAEDDNPSVVEWLALPYADHPDWRAEWRP